MQADWTPLLRASSEGQYQTVEALLTNGADVNVKDKVSRGEWCELDWVSGLFATCHRSNGLTSLWHERHAHKFMRLMAVEKPCTRPLFPSHLHLQLHAHSHILYYTCDYAQNHTHNHTLTLATKYRYWSMLTLVPHASVALMVCVCVCVCTRRLNAEGLYAN